ncbi:hypothetical protein V2J09_007153 [Rumex salicifolius]
MGTNLNFKSFGNEPVSEEGSGAGRPSGNFSLARQSSVYSLTFGEFQNSLGKEFGSMNMDELLKNIWTAEEIKIWPQQLLPMVKSGLQRQGSLTLPRTLSQKTVDEVWRNISNTGNEASMPQGAQRQPTLGEITLEEFLVRAGVVREDARVVQKPNNRPGGFLGDSFQPNNNNTGFGIDFQQPNRGFGLMGGHAVNNGAQISAQSSNLPVNANGARSSHQQTIAAQMPQQKQQQELTQQPIYPKQSAVSYAPMSGNKNLGISGIKGGIVGLANSTMNGTLANSPLQNGGIGMGMGAGAMGVSVGSPATTCSSDGLGKSNGDTPSVSPVPYMFTGGIRGRKGNVVEKVIERRQRRMIKNRESAARSRQRKQAYTMELEQEVQKLKEENGALRQKQLLEMTNARNGSKKRSLRRAMTGPW